MLRRLGLVSALGLSFVWTSAAPATERSCHQRFENDTVVVSSRQAAVFHRRIRNPAADQSAYVACHYKSGRVTRIGTARDVLETSSAGGSDVRAVALNGRFAGFWKSYGGPDTGSSHAISAFDTRTGVRTDRLRIDNEEPSAIANFVVTTTGRFAAAFQTIDYRTNQYADTRILVSGSGPEKAFLDAGLEIDPSSLAVSGRRIYWMNGPEARSALLDAKPQTRF